MASLDPSTIDLATLAWLVGSASNDVLLEQIRNLGHAGVRISHGYVIQHLIDGTPTVSDLASALGVTQQAASKQVAELERLGYVERRVDEADERVRRVVLTARGLELVADSRRVRSELERKLVRSVGEDGVGEARSVLVALASAVGATDDITRRSTRPPLGEPSAGGTAASL